MDRFFIDASAKMPMVLIDPEKGLIEIAGNSIPEDAGSFYRMLIAKVEEYFIEDHPFTNVNIDLKYFNTSTAKWLISLFRLFKKYSDEGKQLFIKWYYDEENDENCEFATDYCKLLNIPIRLLKAS
jgi:hypothetical protein